MRDRGIDRDDQVEIGNQRRGIREVAHLGHDVGQREIRRGRRAVLLQAEELHAGHREQRRQPVGIHRTPAIERRPSARMAARIARPRQADANPRSPHAARRVRHAATCAASACR